MNLMKKKLNKKGFTLAELLIVVAIIAILAAIAIPVFSSQLKNAKIRVDEANLRSAESMAVADVLLHIGETGYASGGIYKVNGAGKDGLEVVKIASGSSWTAGDLKSEVNDSYVIIITVDADGKIVSASTGWTKNADGTGPVAAKDIT